jgi:radical SAM protein with 4Fe4S-binding SPASM domain
MSPPPLGEVFSDSRQVSRFLAKADPHAILAEELGRPFEEYRRGWELAKSFQKIPPFPLHVDYELSRECDLRCPMCLMGELGPSKGSLSPGLVESLISQGAEAGQRAMGFGGLWEPLTSPDIARLVAHGRSKGLVDAMLNTSGLRLSPSLSLDLMEAGLTRVMISLDAATEAAYKIMRPGSDFSLVISNIEELLALRSRKRRRLPLVRLSFCLTSANESELPAFLDRWAGKADFVSIQSFGNFTSKSSRLFPKNPPVPAPSGRCAQPFKRLSVLHDGRVLPCCDLSGLELAMGSVFEQSLESVWKSAPMGSLREALFQGGEALPPDCRRCQDKFRLA